MVFKNVAIFQKQIILRITIFDLPLGLTIF